MDVRKDEQEKLDLSPQMVTIMTTEHYNLQSGRSMTVSDANGRASLYIGAVSSALVAVAFIGQVSRMGAAFFVFSLILFPSLFFLGLVTFERVLQSGIEDTVYARGINRIRHLYLEYAPQMRPYFILSDHDDNAGVMGNMSIQGSWWQLFLTTAGMIGVINSIIIGASVGLLLYTLFNASLSMCVLASVIIFLLSIGLHQRYQWRQWDHVEKNLTVLFPGGPEK